MLDPIILFFGLGAVARLFRSDLRLPPAIYDFLSIFLLLSIGLKGGVELAKHAAWSMLPGIGLMLLLGLTLPLLAFPILRWVGRLSRADSASTAAHYGSVSVGTYAVALSHFATHSIDYESYVTLFLVVLEIPAIVVGVILARGVNVNTRWRPLVREIFAGKAIVCLVGGLLIGWLSGDTGLVAIAPVFFGMFKGMLCLFLLEMGLLCASQLPSLRKHGLFLLAFGVGMPLVSATLGCLAGVLLELSSGGTALVAVLAGSASYIAVPAAMRISVPEANPALSLAASLGVTFPFNILVGIPLYVSLARWFHLS